MNRKQLIKAILKLLENADEKLLKVIYRMLQ